MVVFIKSTAIENPLPFFAQYCVYALIGTVYIKQNIVWHKPSIRSFWSTAFLLSKRFCISLLPYRVYFWTTMNFRRSRLKIRWTINPGSVEYRHVYLFRNVMVRVDAEGLRSWWRGLGVGSGVGILRGTSFLLTPDCYLFLTSFGIYFEITVFKQEI